MRRGRGRPYPNPKENLNKHSNDAASLRWGLRKHAFFLAVVALGVFSLVFLTAVTVLSPRRYELEVGDIAQETIKATKDVEDRVRTDALIKQAVAAIEDVYTKDAKVTDSVMASLDGFFQTVSELSSEVEALKTAWQNTLATAPPAQLPDGTTVQPAPTTVPEFKLDASFLTRAAELLDSDISKDEALWLLTADHAQVDALKEAVSELAGQELAQGILENDFDAMMERVAANLPAKDLSDTQVKIGQKLLMRWMKPNRFFDEAATEAARDKARQEVTPYIYKNGETVVRDGERVTKAQIAVLDSLGLLAQKSIDVKMYLGMSLFIALLLGVVAWYIAIYERALLASPRRTLLLAAVVLIVTGLSAIIGKLKPEFVPVAFGAMVIALMLKTRLALIVNIVLSVIAGLLSGGGTGGAISAGMLTVMLMGIVGGTGGVLLLRRSQQRMTPFYAGIGVGVLNMLTALSIGLMSTGSTSQMLISALWALVNGMVCGVLAIGILPVLEAVFGIVTPMRLMELAHPNQPLLQRLLLEAPGTYHHSIVVGNLAERAAAAIGANEMLARTGAYYHDVGKLKRPIFFKENQMGGENPHDNITPELSTMIITAHTLDGLKLAQEHRLPVPIQEIIVQHHGTTPVAYFYVKARKQSADPEQVNLDDFRYVGPRPQSQEAAIILLADTVEAAVRASSDHSQSAVRALVHKLVRSKLEDGQLDDCPLTMKDLSTIEAAFCQVLSGTFHERIEYPSLESVQASRLTTGQGS